MIDLDGVESASPALRVLAEVMAERDKLQAENARLSARVAEDAVASWGYEERCRYDSPTHWRPRPTPPAGGE